MEKYPRKDKKKGDSFIEDKIKYFYFCNLYLK